MGDSHGFDGICLHITVRCFCILQTSAHIYLPQGNDYYNCIHLSVSNTFDSIVKIANSVYSTEWQCNSRIDGTRINLELHIIMYVLLESSPV